MANKFTLYSFDIFDTLLTRKVAEPTGIFVLMQNILNTDNLYKDIPQDVKTNFYHYRTNAEFYVRRINKLWHDGLDIKFDSIYSYIEKTYFLTSEQTDRIKKLEIKLELESVVPIKENIDILKKLVEVNERVVLISDMYLPEQVIKQMLFNADPILANVKLYLSSELGYMKNTGELFKQVQKQEQVEYSKWCHTGDNEIADFVMARKLGIQANLFKYVQFEDYEKALLEKEFFNPLTQLVLGCTKNLRLNYSDNNKTDLGISLAGTVLYPYVSWLLEQSQKRNIKRLYFIARDGYILKEIADVLIAQRNLAMETYYIYGSRKAWRLSGLDINNEKLYQQFVDMFKYDNKKLHTILGFTKKELVEMLPKELKNYQRSKNKEKVHAYFSQNKEIVVKALEKNKLQKLNTIKYLQNNIDYSDEHFAFVDLDGSCLTQNCLSSIFSEFYNRPIKSFYYAVTPLCYESVNLEKYYFAAFKLPMLGHLIELFTRAPHGQTLGYSENGMPIFEATDSKQLLQWGFDKYLQGILEFTVNIENYSKQYDFISFEAQNIMDFYLNYLYETPDRKTANILGELKHKSYGADNNEFAPKMNVLEAIVYLFTKKCRTENIKFSNIRSDKLAQKIIEYRITHPNLRKQIINLWINRSAKKATLTVLGFTVSFEDLLWGKEDNLLFK